jgi:hypothetical protein
MGLEGILGLPSPTDSEEEGEEGKEDEDRAASVLGRGRVHTFDFDDEMGSGSEQPGSEDLNGDEDFLEGTDSGDEGDDELGM